jgi:hypothetical protein
MVITMSVLPPFTYSNLSLRSHGVITVLCDLQIFLCPANENVTRVPNTVTLRLETSSVLMTLGAVCHHLEASSMKVTFGAIRCADSSPSDPASPRPRPRPRRGWSPAMLSISPVKNAKVCHKYCYEAKVHYRGWSSGSGGSPWPWACIPNTVHRPRWWIVAPYIYILLLV